jgi:single-strand DNA-binding protein
MYNKVELIGRVGKDPEMRAGKSASFAIFSMATTEHYKGETFTTWHNCMAFGKVAENIVKYVGKGSLVHVAGRINHRDYVDKSGVKRYVTQIMVNQIHFLTKNTVRGQDSADASGYQGYNDDAYVPERDGGEYGPGVPPSEEGPLTDDTPF